MTLSRKGGNDGRKGGKGRGREGVGTDRRKGGGRQPAASEALLRNKVRSISSVSCRKVEMRQKSRTEDPSWVHPISDGSGSPTYP